MSATPPAYHGPISIPSKSEPSDGVGADPITVACNKYFGGVICMCGCRRGRGVRIILGEGGLQ